MAIKLAVSSGKGGTGKTSVALSLYHFLDRTGEPVRLVDCDVEEPNGHLFFEGLKPFESRRITRDIPVIDPSACTYCRKCSEWCEFNAILVIPPTRFAEINPALCHSCGACSAACQDGAIRYSREEIGDINIYNTGIGKGMWEGKLRIGSAMQTMLIRELLKSLPPAEELQILDSPPGTSCPVVETISGSDFVVLVTEPTPFGLHDLKLMVELVLELGLEFGVVVNKAGLGNRDVFSYLEQEGIPLLGEIPFERQYAAAYAEGNILSGIPRSIEKAYGTILENIMLKIKEQ